MKQSKELQSEIDNLRLMKDDGIDYSDIPETEDSWFNAAELALEFVSTRPKQKISMMIDDEVLEYFKSSGNGYQTRINAVLKGYVWDRKKRKQKKTGVA